MATAHTKVCVITLTLATALFHRFLFGDQKTRLVLKWMMQWVKEKQRRGRDRKISRLTRDGFSIQPAALSRSSKSCTHRMCLPLKRLELLFIYSSVKWNLMLWCNKVFNDNLFVFFLLNKNSTYVIWVARKPHSGTSAGMPTPHIVCSHSVMYS